MSTIMKRISIMMIILIIFSFYYPLKLEADEAKTPPFGITVGEKINMRDRPGLNGRVIYQFLKGEIALYELTSDNETRIGDDVYRWYKVKTQYPWRKKCVRKKWQTVYENNPVRLEGWVYGKYFKLLDGKLKKEDCILRGIFEQFSGGPFDNLTTIIYNPTLRIVTLGEKEYYIYTIQYQDYSDDCQSYDSSGVYIKQKSNNGYYELTRVSGNDAPFEITDLDNDGYAEIFVQSSDKGISLYSEKSGKYIFSFNFNLLDGEDFWMYQENSYIKIKKSTPIDRTEIIAFWVNMKNELVKKVIFKWNGETFMEEKK